MAAHLSYIGICAHPWGVRHRGIGRWIRGVQTYLLGHGPMSEHHLSRCGVVSHRASGSGICVSSVGVTARYLGILELYIYTGSSKVLLGDPCLRSGYCSTSRHLFHLTRISGGLGRSEDQPSERLSTWFRT